MTRKTRERDRIRTELELTRNNGQSHLVIKAYHPKEMTKSKQPRRLPVPVKRDEESQPAQFVPQMEATVVACIDNVLDANDRANDGDGFGATASGIGAAAYGLGLIASILNIAHTRSRRRVR